jgi:hypothetical protein
MVATKRKPKKPTFTICDEKVEMVVGKHPRGLNVSNSQVDSELHSEGSDDLGITEGAGKERERTKGGH